MKELIKLTSHTIGRRLTTACSAKELHEFLQVSTRFDTWIGRRIDDFGYKNHKDFEVMLEN